VKVHIVSATRCAPHQFQGETALGRSLVRVAHDPRLDVRVATSNHRGLPLVYNEILDQLPLDGIVVFMHDDIWVDDCFMLQRITEGLEHFDVIGIAGNRRRIPHQPAWHFTNMKFERDLPEYLSGTVAMGPDACGPVSYYGAAPARCQLLDGMFLAAKTRTLKEREVRFDPIFDFHFYDLDFCRTAAQQGLQLGTWPISLTHQGDGIFGTPEWRSNHQAYMMKWGD
jgi:GT2 family glycosyltransferase